MENIITVVNTIVTNEVARIEGTTETVQGRNNGFEGDKTGNVTRLIHTISPKTETLEVEPFETKLLKSYQTIVEEPKPPKPIKTKPPRIKTSEPIEPEPWEVELSEEENSETKTSEEELSKTETLMEENP